MLLPATITKESEIWETRNRGTVEARELNPGDVLVLPFRSAQKNKNFPLSFQKENKKFPKTMTPDLAWLIGTLFAQQILSNESDDPVNLSDVVVQKMSGVLLNLFSNAGNADRITEFLNDNCINPDYENLVVPNVIVKSSEESIVAFFSGIVDCMGTIEKKGEYIFSVEILLRQEKIANLLQHLGILCGLVFHNIYDFDIKESYTLQLALRDSENTKLFIKHSAKCYSTKLMNHPNFQTNQIGRIREIEKDDDIFML